MDHEGAHGSDLLGVGYLLVRFPGHQVASLIFQVLGFCWKLDGWCVSLSECWAFFLVIFCLLECEKGNLARLWLF